VANQDGRCSGHRDPACRSNQSHCILRPSR